MRVVLVTGTRSDYMGVVGIVTSKLEESEPDFLILGCCKSGVDAIAKSWAMAHGVSFRVHYADWRGPLFRGAGPERNGRMVAHAKEMIGLGHDVFCLAFPMGASPGTLDCVRQAKAAGLEVYECSLSSI